MTISIDPTSFNATATKERNGFSWEEGTVSLNIHGKAETSKANRFNDGEIRVIGFVGRYRTSNNPWRASVIFSKDGALKSVDFGRDDRSGRFNKLNAISYEPETYEGAS